MTSVELDAVKSCIVPSFSKGNDVRPTEKDFDDYRAVIDDRLKAVNDFLSLGFSTQSEPDNIELLSLLLVLCGEHSEPSLWSTEISLRLARDIFNSVTTFYGDSHDHSIFLNEKIVRKVLTLSRPKLLPDTFRCNLAATLCYRWLLTNIQSPMLGEILPELLPTALILTDDYEPLNIKLGLNSLNHITENVAAERLRWYGQDEVILDVLKKCLFWTEPDIVSCHLKCFTSLMSCVLQRNKSLKRNGFDELIKMLLVSMYAEKKLDLRRIYASYLAAVIEARGLGVVRHLTMIFKVLDEYAQETTTTSLALQALTKVVQVCWCRGDSVGESVLVILMKLLIISSRTPSNFTQIAPEVRQMGILLVQTFPAVVDKFMDNLRNNRDSFDEGTLLFVEDVFKSPHNE